MKHKSLSMSYLLFIILLSKQCNVMATVTRCYTGWISILRPGYSLPIESVCANAEDANVCVIITYSAGLAINYLCATNSSCDPDTYGTYGFNDIYCCYTDNCNRMNASSTSFKIIPSDFSMIYAFFYVLFKLFLRIK